MEELTSTIGEALEFAPPEHLEVALMALIEARFIVLPKADLAYRVPFVNLQFPNSASTAPWSSRTCGRGSWRGRTGCRRWKNSFFGDLHAHGKDAVAFYTEQKVIMSRWF